MTEKQKFISRLQAERARGLLDLHFTFGPDARFEDEETYYKTMNEVLAAIDDPAMIEDIDFDKYLPQKRF